jgi:hypothetical protein
VEKERVHKHKGRILPKHEMYRKFPSDRVELVYGLSILVGHVSVGFTVLVVG